MVQNLKISGVTLHAGDSNVTRDIAIPTAVSIETFTTTNSNSQITNGGTGGTFLYNWHAAVAYPNGTAVEGEINPITSVCPKGWQLPESYGNKSFYHLFQEGEGIYEYVNIDSYVNGGSFDKLSQPPFSITTTGWAWAYGLAHPDFGFYMTRNSYNSGSARVPSPRDTIFILTNYDPKSYGYAIRCVAQ